MILIVDNYDSFTYNLVHLVAQSLDEGMAGLQVSRNDQISLEEIEELSPGGILISPGPGRPEDAGITCDIVREFGENVPILGVCLGHQAIGHVFGGSITFEYMNPNENYWFYLTDNGPDGGPALLFVPVREDVDGAQFQKMVMRLRLSDPDFRTEFKGTARCSAQGRLVLLARASQHTPAAT